MVVIERTVGRDFIGRNVIARGKFPERKRLLRGHTYIPQDGPSKKKYPSRTTKHHRFGVPEYP